MNKLITLLAGFLMLTHPGSGSVQSKFYFNRLGVENGLTQNTVSCILQDHLGFMWFGTKDGLNRYDGYKFRTFRAEPGNPRSLGSNFIRSLHEAPDDRLWIGTNTGVYIYDPHTEQFSRFDLRTADGTQIAKEVNDIRSDSSGCIWFCVNWQGVFRYEPAQQALKYYRHSPDDSTTISSVNPWSICFDDADNPWLVCHNGGLSMYDREKEYFRRYSTGIRADIYKIVKDNHGQLLIGTANQGAYVFNPHNRACTPLIASPGYENLYVRDIFVRNSNEVWLATESGIYIHNYDTRHVQNLTQEFSNPYSLSCKAIYSIYRDKEGAVWVGTYFGGVSYLPAPSTFFEKHYPTGADDRLSGKAVREFVQDEDGAIWIGTEDAGLNRFDPGAETFTHYNVRNSGLSYNNIHALHADGDELYVGTFNGGLNVMNRKTGQVENFRKGENCSSLCDDNVFSIYRDRQDNLWIGMIYGLNLFDRQSGMFRNVTEIGDRPFIYDIFQGSNGTIYFAAYNNGVYTYNPYLGKWGRISAGNDSSRLLMHVVGISEDSRSNIWFGTEGMGMIRYTPASGAIKAFGRREGMPNDVVYKIVEDRNKNLWASTNKGLVRYDPISGSIKVFTSKDGLTSDQFNYKSGFMAADGKLYFGTINGFVSFYPDQFTANNNISPVVLTDFSLIGGSPAIGDKRSPLACSVPYAKKIRLHHDQSTFNLDFALLSYNASTRNRYKYIMRNYIDEWTTLATNQTVTFSNMPAGKYVFEVMGANSDGIWNELPAKIQIEVLPPFYASTAAYMLYALAGLLLAWLGVRKYARRIRQRNMQKIEEIRLNRERADYKAKVEFFTNIIHEIRTPLALIKGPFEQIIKPKIKPSDYKENIEIMGGNIARLLNLSNQLLDFRKIESDNYPLTLGCVDMKKLLNDCGSQFAQKIRQKGLEFEVILPNGDVVAKADPEAMTKIACNLLDNAVKFATGRVVLSLEATEKEAPGLTLTVSNDGEPIPVRFRERIFEPFFQVKNNYRSGTGLGLPLVRHLVEQHAGTIEVDTENERTVFRIQLPWDRQQAERAADNPAAGAQPDKPRAQQPQAPDHGIAYPDRDGILIVDDDPGMQSFLRNILSATFNVWVASGGDEAAELLDGHCVNLIVSDVMMPGMDGFELCRFLKSRIDYSHIPVILLSAKSDTGSKITGLESGADAYIEKPFSGDHLIAQIHAILNSRATVRETFSQQPLAGVSTVGTGKADRQFLNRITEIVDQNLADEHFCIDELSDIMSMSRSSLHRKIKALVNVTPNDFIRLIRLKKAAEMLHSGEYRVNEISFMVGFNSPSYFAKCFHKQFGVLPKQFVAGRRAEMPGDDAGPVNRAPDDGEPAAE